LISENKRLLVTTADERSWGSDESILFLGEWCLLDCRKESWESLDYRVLPGYGVGSKTKVDDYGYVNIIYERLIIEVGHKLNSFHNIVRSERYWRILLGPWLYKFTSIAFNRWKTIQLVLENKPLIKETILLQIDQKTLVAGDTHEFTLNYFSDIWNHYFYGQILKEWTDINITYVDIRHKNFDKLESSNRSHNNSYRSKLSCLFSKVSGLLSKDTDIFISSSTLPMLENIKLLVALGQIPLHWHSPKFDLIVPDDQLRVDLGSEKRKSSGFEACVRSLVFDHIPTCFLEGFIELNSVVDLLPWPKKPKVIYTANSFDTDEVFKVWTADKVESGSKYVIGQHGGNYGTLKYTPSEKHEVLTADYYFTWGWHDDNKKHYPAIASTIANQSISNHKLGGLLLIQVHRTLRCTPWDETVGYKKYLESQFSFVENLNDKIKGNVTVRLHAAYKILEWNEDMLWNSRSPEVSVDNGKSPIASLIRRSRLIVYSYNSTGILETLALNVPTVFFWDESFIELRESARPYYEALRKVGVFHDSEKSASTHVNEIWDDVHEWWQRNDVQEARRSFCEQYARVRSNPIQFLKDALLKVSDEYEE
jgi:putative transferase (TIGR04331 family)